MRRRLAVLAAALFVAAGWFVVTAPAGGAAGSLDTAWWWQGEASTGAVPPPPTVPDGGLWVSSNASGPQAVSALRVTLDPGDAAPTLTVDVHQSVPPTVADLVAYPTSTPWTPGPAQAWSSKPVYDGNGVHAAGTMTADGKHVTFDLSGLVTGDVLSIVIAPAAAAAPPAAVPLPAPPPPAPPSFDVTFEKPAPAALQVTPGAAPTNDDSAAAAAIPATPPLEDVGALPTDSFDSAVATGLSAPLPAVASSQPPARAPSVAFRNAPQQFVPAVAKRSAGASAAIAVMLGIVLVWVARDTAASGGTRRRLSLYDAPKPAEALAMSRTGTPPALR
jgi:hypothetical protein